MNEASFSADDLDSQRGVLVLKQTLGSEILNMLYQFFRLCEIHDPNNAAFQRAVNDVYQAFQVWIQIPQFERLDFSLNGEQIFLNQIRIRPKPRQLGKIHYLVHFFKKRRIVGFCCEKMPTHEVLSRILWALFRATPDSEFSSDTGDFRIKSLLWKSDSQAVRSLAHELSQQLYAFVEACFEDLKRASLLKPVALDRIIETFGAVDQSDLMGLLCKWGVAGKAKKLPSLSVKSCILLFAWARSLGLPHGVITELTMAGLAHPLVLLNQKKAEIFDLREMDASVIAFQNMERLKFVWPLTPLQVLAVLEWSIPYGKTGVYDLGRTKCYQHFFSRMLRIVSLFYQLIATPEMPADQALEKLLTPEMGCDPTLARLFVNWLGVYPLGGLVRLTTGETAQICSTAKDMMHLQKPVVGILKDQNGNILETPKILDLGQIDAITAKIGIQEGISFEKSGISLDTLDLISSSLVTSVSV